MVFHLNQPDLTFLKVLTHRHGVDRGRGDRSRPTSCWPTTTAVGSGPYKLSQYKPGEQAVFEANPRYHGHRDPEGPAGLRPVLHRPGAAQDGGRDRRGRHRLAHAEPDRPQLPRGRRQGRGASAARARSSATGSGSSAPGRQGQGRPSGRRPAHRPRRHRARTPTTARSPRRTPSCPPGFGGQKDSFQEKYGEPDVDTAKQILDDGRRQDPGAASRSATRPTHYGPNAVDEANELAEQLNSSGLFEATTRRRRVGGVPDALQGGRLRPLHPGLVPRLPGRRQLPDAVHP